MILKILNRTVLKILNQKINPKIKFEVHSWLVRADYGTILCQVEYLFNLAYFFPVFSISSEKIDLKINFEVSALTEQTAEKLIRGRVEYYIDLTIFFPYFQSALRSETKPHFLSLLSPGLIRLHFHQIRDMTHPPTPLRITYPGSLRSPIHTHPPTPEPIRTCIRSRSHTRLHPYAYAYTYPHIYTPASRPGPPTAASPAPAHACLRTHACAHTPASPAHARTTPDV